MTETVRMSEGKRGPIPLAPPQVSLPKGGGAIRGIGEKFTANPVTGTGAMTVPVPTSPGRSGFGPELSLSYDSGTGNGAFGIGWGLFCPSITRKTDKGLPRYLDGEESDVFILSGAEDLVPELLPSGDRFEDRTSIPGYTVQRYRPRIEGLFARIERWTRKMDGDVHWRSISKDNTLTIYGKDGNSRIADPSDPTRVFSWLMSETRDDKGNAIIYLYKPEDGTGIDLAQAHERNRGDRESPVRKANRYLKRILYGNRRPLLDASGRRPRLLPETAVQDADWMFEVVFDYGEHEMDEPRPCDANAWLCRNDPFSSYRAGFEVRTYRLCQRILMFHHFPEEEGVGADCLVSSLELAYKGVSDDPADRGRGHPIASFLASMTRSGFKRRAGGGYLNRSLPSLEFEYSEAIIGEEVEAVDPIALENLRGSMGGPGCRWVDLDGEGITGILREQGGGWYYKRNESPLARDPGGKCRGARFAPLEKVFKVPSMSSLATDRWQFLDLAGDGQVDLVSLRQPMAGFYERTDDHDWEPFRPFRSMPNLAWDDPHLKLIDLTGDGHADILIMGDRTFTWQRSLAEAGFDSAEDIASPTEGGIGPNALFSDDANAVFLADLSGDGLTDLVRISNGEVCFWPNLGYGRFGAKVTMDSPPWFDTPDQFDPRRILLADIDGSGVTDIIYLGRERTRFWFNRSGNSWSEPRELPGFPTADSVSSAVAVDLLGDGTACLVWSTSLPEEERSSMRFIRLMSQGKPHLMIRSRNNLGAETRVRYAPSTYFYLRDLYNGKPWRTKLPFPVQVVERVEEYDRVSRSRFVTRYAYHHGYFDGQEREFRGFGMVERWDTEDLGVLADGRGLPTGDNYDDAFRVPPALTKTWFHTGALDAHGLIGGASSPPIVGAIMEERYREPGLTDEQAISRSIEGAVLPPGLAPEEEMEACRALKGSMLRQEIYALDATDREPHPYTVMEQALVVACLQPRGSNRHAVFMVHTGEALSYHYERNPADPRISHMLTLEVDGFGNALKEASIGYGRRRTVPAIGGNGEFAEAPNPGLGALDDLDQERQTKTLITYTENRFTYAVGEEGSYRTPLLCQSCTYELTGYLPTGEGGRFRHSDFVSFHQSPPAHIFDEEIDHSKVPTSGRQRRLIEMVRTLYRKDDLTGMLPLGELEPLALPGEHFRLAFTAGLLEKVFRRQRAGRPTEDLLSAPTDVLEGSGPDGGGYVAGGTMVDAGLFPETDLSDHRWTRIGQVFLSLDPGDGPAEELAFARCHFFMLQRFRDPFHSEASPCESFVIHDGYDLLIQQTIDPMGNRVTVGEIDASGQPASQGNDYRTLQPWLVTDPNGNRLAVAFDTLAMTAGTAAMGKAGERAGDSLADFKADLEEGEIMDHLSDPLTDPHSILLRASTRLVYDLFAFQRTRDGPDPQPSVVYSLTRETHDACLEPGQRSRVQHSFSYSDGFGRQVQRKVQAEPERGAAGPGFPRWVGSGWTIFNNKGNPVRQYEPFFSATHRFELARAAGVGPTLFYDPMSRVVAVLHPNNTYEKVIFDPWRQSTWDANDTAAAADNETGDPRTDADIGGYVASYFGSRPGWQTWYQERIAGGKGTIEKSAAQKALPHAGTPSVTHFDALGRAFLSIAHCRSVQEGDDGPAQAVEGRYLTRSMLDISGNLCELSDAFEPGVEAQGRLVMRYAYDMTGNRIHQSSSEAGERWSLYDVAGKPIRVWDGRGQAFRFEYDRMRRPLRRFVAGTDPSDPGSEILIERLVYGEQHPEGDSLNLRGRSYLHLDQAGMAINERHDFKGNLVRVTRRLARDYARSLNWSETDLILPADGLAILDRSALEAAMGAVLESEVFATSTAFDALDRPESMLTPDGSTIRARYNEANLLEGVEVNLQGESSDGQPLWTPIITNIDYNAKGQRARIDYGNGASSLFEYDPLSFHLVSLLTQREIGAFPEDCPEPPPAGWPGSEVQNLHYTYDPVGNITHVRDEAQQAVFFRGRWVEPSNDFTYDPMYRLIEARGREHLGQACGAPFPHSHDDLHRVGLPHPNDGQAMGNYVEEYLYDAAGNIRAMKHRGADPSHPGWSRRFTYEEASLLEPGRRGNRLSGTSVGSDDPQLETYAHDEHGNITRLPHLANDQGPAQRNLHWDCQDRLRQVDLAGGGTAYYVYDAAGRRIRKICERSPGLREERIYIGCFEVHRRRNGAGDVTLERQTLHIMREKERFALVETRTKGDDPAPRQLVRYQLSNHLGSASLELDQEGRIISYEEFTPYGSTSYQAVRAQTETPKRYRYTGNERDDESGLYYHGARYYAPWLGRWTAPDPAGAHDSICLYCYVADRPTMLTDPDGLQGGPESRFNQRMEIAKQKGIPPDMVGVPTKDSPTWQKVLFGIEQRIALAGVALVTAPVLGGAPLWAQWGVGGLAAGWGGYTTGTAGVELVTGKEGGIGAELEPSERILAGVDVGVGVVAMATMVAKRPPRPRSPRAPSMTSPEAPPPAAVKPLKAPKPPPPASTVSLPDDKLIARSKAIFEKAAAAYLKDAGKPVTPGAIARMKREMTIGVLQGERNGQLVTKVAVQDPKFQKFVEPLLGPGEELVEAIVAPRLNARTGLPNKTGYITVHSEQVLAMDAVDQGLQNARVATSNNGCLDLCVSNIGENYQNVRHVNPSKK